VTFLVLGMGALLRRRKRASLAVAAAALASLAVTGCVGELTTEGGTGTGGGTGGGGGGGSSSSAARLAYENDVFPVMQTKCGGCHAAAGPVGNVSGFVAPDKSTAHATVIGFTSVVGSFAPTAAPVLLKVQAGHQGIVYSSDETNKITAWLDAEVIEQNGGAGGGSGSGSGSGSTETPAAATARVMNAWSACMTKTNFDSAEMANAWGNMTANNNQRCSNCHASGDGGFIATVDSQLMFDVVSSNKYYMLQYMHVKLDLSNLANSTMEINTQSFMGVSGGQAPHLEHPRFNATDNNGMRALEDFYNTTKAAVAAGGCGPSKLTN